MTSHRDRARALLAAATPGPWELRLPARGSRDDCAYVYRTDGARTQLARTTGGQRGKANAALIAAAPTLLAALCDELDARGAQVARLREVLADCIHGLMINDDAEASQAADTARAALVSTEEAT